MLVVMLTCLATLVACLRSPSEHAAGWRGKAEVGRWDVQRTQPTPIADICRKYGEGYGTMSTSAQSRVNSSDVDRCDLGDDGTEKGNAARRSDVNAGQRQAELSSSYPPAKNLKLHLDTGSLALFLSNDLPFPSSRGFSLSPPKTSSASAPTHIPAPSKEAFTSDEDVGSTTAPKAVFTYRFDRDTSLEGQGKISLHLSTTGDPLALHGATLSLRLKRICSWMTHGRALLSTSLSTLSSLSTSSSPAPPPRPEFICTPGKGAEMLINTHTVLTVEDTKRRIVRLDGTFEVLGPLVFLVGDELQLQIFGGIDERTGSQVIHSGDGVDSFVVFGS